jgi:hypothetical protein
MKIKNKLNNITFSIVLKLTNVLTLILQYLAILFIFCIIINFVMLLITYKIIKIMNQFIYKKFKKGYCNVFIAN